MEPSIRDQYLRPLKLSMLVTIGGELSIFVIWGAFLYPHGDLIYKFLWAVLFCGVGMGAVVGSLIDLIIVQRFDGTRAIFATVAIFGGVLGVGCNLLCFSLDQHFNYFGANETPLLFLGSGFVMSLIGGVFVGWLLFSEKGRLRLSWI